MILAARIAQAMADNAIGRLPRLTRHASPEFARELLEAYYRLRDELQEIRRIEGDGCSLTDRIAASSVCLQVDDAIRHTRAWLSLTARRGGRGLRLKAPAAQESVSVQQ